MMGSKEQHFAPLVNVSLEALVPLDHFYRHLEKSLDLSFVREFVRQTYSGGGRSSIDPVVFYDPEQDVYMCPNNAVLRLHTSSPSEHAKRYQAEAATCNACPLKAQCTPGTSGRYVSRNFAEEYFERVRSYQTTEAYKKALRKRSVWVEPLFAEGKEWHGMRRFRLRELWRVNCEGLMRAAGQNLKRLLKKRGWGRRPFPAEAMSASFWALLRDVRVLVLQEWLFLVLISSAYSMVRTQCVPLCC